MIANLNRCSWRMLRVFAPMVWSLARLWKFQVERDGLIALWISLKAADIPSTTYRALN